MLDLKHELKQPMEDPGWIIKIIIGAALIVSSSWHWLFFLLTFFAFGYIYRHFAAHLDMRAKELLPDWKNWQDLFLKGVIIFLILLGYFVIPRFSYMVTDSILMGGLLAKFVGLVFMAVTALLYVAAIFFIPMGIANFARSERISQAFSIKDVWEKIMDVGDDYFKLVLMAIVTIIALYIIRLVPLLGPIVAALAGFYVTLAIAALFGEVCREAEGLEPAPTAVEEEPVETPMPETEETEEEEAPADEPETPEEPPAEEREIPEESPAEEEPETSEEPPAESSETQPEEPEPQEPDKT
jgi:hypothetical protein